MSTVVRIPTPLRRITGGQDKVTANGNNLREVIDSIDGQFDGIKERMCDDSGELRNFVNVYVNGEDVRFLDGLNTEINTGDEISIVPAVAGGSI
jgi:molybdopterin synthase sulfur carrier subunit